jgi:hypothetical protein
MNSMRRLAALVLLGSAALVAPGCLSPTLPLPPPEEPDLIRSVGEGSWLVSGSCDKDAQVIVFNERTGEGVVRTCERGVYDATLAGKRCDRATISEELDATTSPTTEFVLENVVSGSPTDDTCQ